VVLRPGAPKDKGRMADVLACLFGALLLLVAIVLVAVLPDKEYAAPQFRLTFPDTLDDFTYPTQEFSFAENNEALRVHEFTYELPDNVASINLRAEFTDDLPHSDPDQFRLEVFDPSGNPVGPRYEAINQPPLRKGDPNDPTNYTRFEFDSFSTTFNLPTGEHPTEQIISGLTHTETKEQVLARLVPQYRFPSGGVWTVRVTLIQANDCPAPSGDTDVFQFANCRNESPDGSDLGNDFALAAFIYTFYTPCIESLGAVPAEKPLCATP
jgi:hypothetical protein